MSYFEPIKNEAQFNAYFCLLYVLSSEEVLVKFLFYKTKSFQK